MDRNLSLAVVFPGLSGGKHHHLSSSRCVSSVMAVDSCWSCSVSLHLRTEWLEVQGFVLKGSFDTAEHPSILHPRTRRVGAQSGQQGGAVVLRRTPPLRHHRHIWEQVRRAAEDQEEEEEEEGWLKTSERPQAINEGTRKRRRRGKRRPWRRGGSVTSIWLKLIRGSRRTEKWRQGGSTNAKHQIFSESDSHCLTFVCV